MGEKPQVNLNGAKASPVLSLRVHERRQIVLHLPRLVAYFQGKGCVALSMHPAWLGVLVKELRHAPYCLEVVEGDRTRGFLALAYMHSYVFGRYLVSLPYLNYGGVMADDARVAGLLIDRAVRLADELGVRHLELRHEHAVAHPRLSAVATGKAHMRRYLPATAEELWDQLGSKVRNQVRKGRKNQPSVAWGGPELLDDFYHVFSHNMRDLGTPVYGRGLFREVLAQFPGRAELCVVRAPSGPRAAALLLHGPGLTEVPSASSLRRFNHGCANMLMYWHLLERAVQRRQGVFDFGRCTFDSSTYLFKKQWGAEPSPVGWQYYIRAGDGSSGRRENPRYQRLIRLWRLLPVRLTRFLGPLIVRGIP
jgi:FemAB-related protein (PEP-CTERM system-associated)